MAGARTQPTGRRSRSTAGSHCLYVVCAACRVASTRALMYIRTQAAGLATGALGLEALSSRARAAAWAGLVRGDPPEDRACRTCRACARKLRAAARHLSGGSGVAPAPPAASIRGPPLRLIFDCALHTPVHSTVHAPTQGVRLSICARACSRRAWPVESVRSQTLRSLTLVSVRAGRTRLRRAPHRSASTPERRAVAARAEQDDGLHLLPSRDEPQRMRAAGGVGQQRQQQPLRRQQQLQPSQQQQRWTCGPSQQHALG